MPKANLYDMAGKQIGEIELSEAIFGIEPNEAVVHEVVKNHPGARRAPATPVRVPPGLPSGPTAASCLPPSPAPIATP